MPTVAERAFNGTGMRLTILKSDGTTREIRVIGQVKVIGVSIAAIDVTDHSSTSVQRIQGDVPDYGAMEFTGHADPDQDNPVDYGHITATALYPRKMGGGSHSGEAFFTKYDPGMPFEGHATAAYTLQWAGKPTYAPGVGAKP